MPEERPTGTLRVVKLAELPGNDDLVGVDPTDAFVESVKALGILQPVALVEVDPADPRAELAGVKYQVAAGRRRIKTARLLEFDEVPALVFAHGTQPVDVAALVENTHRKSNAASEVDALRHLDERLRAAGEALTDKALALRLGLPVATVKKRRRLLSLDGVLFGAFMRGGMKSGVAEAASKLSPTRQAELVKLAQKSAIAGGNARLVVDAKMVRHVRETGAVATQESLAGALFGGTTPGAAAVETATADRETLLSGDLCKDLRTLRHYLLSAGRIVAALRPLVGEAVGFDLSATVGSDLERVGLVVDGLVVEVDERAKKTAAASNVPAAPTPTDEPLAGLVCDRCQKAAALVAVRKSKKNPLGGFRVMCDPCRLAGPVELTEAAAVESWNEEQKANRLKTARKAAPKAEEAPPDSPATGEPAAAPEPLQEAAGGREAPFGILAVALVEGDGVDPEEPQLFALVDDAGEAFSVLCMTGREFTERPIIEDTKKLTNDRRFWVCASASVVREHIFAAPTSREVRQAFQAALATYESKLRDYLEANPEAAARRALASSTLSREVAADAFEPAPETEAEAQARADREADAEEALVAAELEAANDPEPTDPAERRKWKERNRKRAARKAAREKAVEAIAGEAAETA